MNLLVRSLAVVLLPWVAGCPKDGGVAAPAGRRTEVVVLSRTPVGCAQLHKEDGEGHAVETLDGRGCNAAVRFHLSPSGHRDVALPHYPDAAEPGARRDRVDGSVLRRTVVLKDPAGERAWEVELDDDILPWQSSGRCARPAGGALTTFDASAWRFLVVRVQSRDALGELHPFVQGQSDTLDLRVTPDAGGGDATIAVVPSTSDEATWAVAWCADAFEGPYALRLGVSGAEQVRPDTFQMPAPGSDTYTYLDYTVRPRVEAPE